MKKALQNDEWSVEPVRGTEPDASVVGLIRLLEILEHHLVELQAKRNAAAYAPEHIIR